MSNGDQTARSARDIPIWTRDEIESPCVQICVIHPDTRLCAGCARSIDEIGAWSRMSADERRETPAAKPSLEI